METFASVGRVLAGILLVSSAALAQNAAPILEIDRKGETIVLEPYAPNILRVTLSLSREPALAAPGYGVIAKPAGAGTDWKARGDTAGGHLLLGAHGGLGRAPRNPPRAPQHRTQQDIGKYFRGSAPGAHITFRTPYGQKLLELTGWSQAVPNHKDEPPPCSPIAARPIHPRSSLALRSASPDDEHYYGLGQNQEGFLDHRGHPVRCWARLHRARRSELLRAVPPDK